MEQGTDLLPILAEAGAPQPQQEFPAGQERESAVQKIKRADARREGFPGEHWLVLALGVGVWHFTRRHPGWAMRTAGAFAASMLVARAASGRDGLAKVMRYTPLGGRIVRSPQRSS